MSKGRGKRPLKKGGRAAKVMGNKRRAKFQPWRMSDRKAHPVTVRKLDEESS